MTETVQPATPATTTRFVPVEPGREMLVRFHTRAQKVLGEPGNQYFSRQRTGIPTGETLVCVQDEGRDSYLIARWGKFLVQVYRGDLIFKPGDRDVAFLSSRADAQGVALEEAKDEASTLKDAVKALQALAVAAQTEAQALRQALAEATDANRRLQERLDQADVQIDQAIAQKRAWIARHNALTASLRATLDADVNGFRVPA